MYAFLFQSNRLSIQDPRNRPLDYGATITRLSKYNMCQKSENALTRTIITQAFLRGLVSPTLDSVIHVRKGACYWFLMNYCGEVITTRWFLGFTMMNIMLYLILDNWSRSVMAKRCTPLQNSTLAWYLWCTVVGLGSEKVRLRLHFLLHTRILTTLSEQRARETSKPFLVLSRRTHDSLRERALAWPLWPRRCTV